MFLSSALQEFVSETLRYLVLTINQPFTLHLFISKAEMNNSCFTQTVYSDRLVKLEVEKFLSRKNS